MDLRTLLGERIDPDWDHLLARRLLGTDEPDEMAVVIEDLVAGVLRDDVRRGLHYHESVGIVVGVELAGGDRVAVKLHRPERTDCLEERCRIQEHLRLVGLPCPEVVVEATPVGTAVVTVERWLDGGPPDPPDAATTRRALADGLRRFIAEARPFVDAELAVAMEPEVGSPYPEPHDLRFDFEGTSEGAEWIDELAWGALGVLDLDEPDAVGHVDWRCANVVVSGGALTAIYDWDSIAVGTEPVFVGSTSTTWSVAWEWGHRALPDAGSMEAFVRDYEDVAGRTFTDRERQAVRAAQVLTLAYLARCEHSDRLLGVDTALDTRFAELLRAVAAQAGWLANQSS